MRRMRYRFLVILVCATLTPVELQAQNRRWELGAQLARLDLNSIGESPLGAGGRVSYLPRPYIALEAEANRYFEDPSHNFGHTEILAGVRAGYWLGPFGLFAKARPGFVRLGGAAAARNPGRENNAALNIGGVLMLGRGRFGARIDGGDTMIFWGSEPFDVGVPRSISIHNRQLSLGFVVRF